MTILPMELITSEILPRLPPSSLLRFKCVCKHFQTLISTPNFIHSHLHHSLSSDANRRLIFINDSDQCLYSVDFNIPNPEVVRLPLFNPFGYDVALLGCCNGLVCFIGHNSLFRYSFCNPSTGTYNILTDEPDYGTLFSCYGLGYDDVNDDYKLVRIFDQYDDESGDYDFISGPERREITVYSSRTCLVERWPDIISPGDAMVVDNCAVMHNHLLHFMFWKQSKEKHMLRCFDICREQWGEDIPLPKYNHEGIEQVEDVVDLGVFDGCLCLLAKNHQHSTTDVWMLKFYGVEQSWMKFLGFEDVVVSRSLFFVPIAYGSGSRDEVLLWQSKQYSVEIVWYNLRSKKAKRAEINCDVSGVWRAFVFQGSLVTIPGGKHIRDINQVQATNE